MVTKQMMRTAVRNAIVFFLLALPAGILAAGVFSGPSGISSWSANRMAEGFLYVWLGAALPFGLGFLAHQVGMVAVSRLSPQMGSHSIVFLTAPLLFLWLLVPGVNLDPPLLEAPLAVLGPLAVGAVLYVALARPPIAGTPDQGANPAGQHA